ncbi:MAG: hypothetical protein HKN23_11500 [Verrucomicrobiales bacterium]|nr:hypothetical protein [Verrucomicrobiales bacterium]
MPISSQHESILRKAILNEQGWFAVQTLLDRGKADDAMLDGFLGTVDDSHYSLGDWLEALYEFDRWLTEKSIEARPLADMIGYVHCCTMTTAETLSPPELARLLRENLDQFGFEAASPVSDEEP